LSAQLWEKNLCIPNLGYFSFQTIGGAISTTNHASSTKYGSLATSVVALDLITANGEVLHITKDNKDLFDAARNGLGCLGVISSVTLQCVNSFYLEVVLRLIMFTNCS
jgi:L-gulonolactone oxidase